MSKVKKAEPVVDQESNELLALALKNIQTDKQDLVEKMNTLLSQGKEKVKDSIVEALTQIDKSILETRDKKYVPKDFGKRRFWIPEVGMIHFKRRRYYNTSTKKYVYLLDEKIGLVAYKCFLPKYQEMAVAKYPVYHSYSKIKQNVFNNQVSISAVGQFIKNTVVKPQFKNYDCGTEGKLIVNPDGFWLNKHASSEAVEVKNVALFTGWEKEGKDRCKLKSRNISSFLEKDVATICQATKAIIENYYSHVKYIQVVGDGASWIKELAGYLQAEYFIDKWHVLKKIRITFPKTKRKKVLKTILSDLPKKEMRLKLYEMITNHKTGEVNDKKIGPIHYLVKHSKAFKKSVHGKMHNAIEFLQAHYQGKYFKNRRKGYKVETLEKLITSVNNQINLAN